MAKENEIKKKLDEIIEYLKEQYERIEEIERRQALYEEAMKLEMTTAMKRMFEEFEKYASEVRQTIHEEFEVALEEKVEMPEDPVARAKDVMKVYDLTVALTCKKAIQIDGRLTFCGLGYWRESPYFLSTLSTGILSGKIPSVSSFQRNEIFCPLHKFEAYGFGTVGAMYFVTIATGQTTDDDWYFVPAWIRAKWADGDILYPYTDYELMSQPIAISAAIVTEPPLFKETNILYGFHTYQREVFYNEYGYKTDDERIQTLGVPWMYGWPQYYDEERFKFNVPKLEKISSALEWNRRYR